MESNFDLAVCNHTSDFNKIDDRIAGVQIVSSQAWLKAAVNRNHYDFREQMAMKKIDLLRILNDSIQCYEILSGHFAEKPADFL